jgi:hypothetical protein
MCIEYRRETVHSEHKTMYAEIGKVYRITKTSYIQYMGTTENIDTSGLVHTHGTESTRKNTFYISSKIQ